VTSPEQSPRRFQLETGRYDSDKISNGYLERYDPVLSPWLDKEIVLLELGVRTGGSLLLWRDYFPLATVVGVDIKLPADFTPGERIHTREGNQADRPFLSSVAEEFASGGFDIIIDDASHIAELTGVSFWHLFEHHLRPGGLYVIEDWGTGYWDDWPDGRSLDLETYRRPAGWRRRIWSRIARRLRLKMRWPGHAHGMPALIKQLVDEQAAADVTRRRWEGTPTRRSYFERMIITPSIVFIQKAGR